ncbi:MAG: GxxExxY protein [Acidobacteriota bacterium]
MPELILKDEVYAIAGAAMEVYYRLGVGFLEPVYQEALSIELSGRAIPYVREERLKIFYKGIELNKIYRPDFVCYGQIIVELKCQFRLTGVEEAQIINYLKITNMHVGLLMNFGARPKLEWKRYVI